MIHEIQPHELHNEYVRKEVSEGSNVILFRNDEVLCSYKNEIQFPIYEDMINANYEYIYLFDVNGIDYFLARGEHETHDSKYSFMGVNSLRNMGSDYLTFACLTAYHLYNWYNDNKYCGRCQKPLSHSETERAMMCDECKNIIYPRISPVVIVGVVNGDRLLMTKYADRAYTRYALIAGFIEIGEDAEGAVKREVMEETGVNVKNITYYKSQPWGISGGLLFGYYAQLDGDSAVSIDNKELSEASWIHRDDITTEPDNFSLTNEMICNFKDPKFSLF